MVVLDGAGSEVVPVDVVVVVVPDDGGGEVGAGGGTVLLGPSTITPGVVDAPGARNVGAGAAEGVVAAVVVAAAVGLTRALPKSTSRKVSPRAMVTVRGLAVVARQPLGSTSTIW